jgi:hypothetical protein
MRDERSAIIEALQITVFVMLSLQSGQTSFTDTYGGEHRAQIVWLLRMDQIPSIPINVSDQVK